MNGLHEEGKLGGDYKFIFVNINTSLQKHTPFSI